MRIGDSVTYQGRTYIVVGFTPMSVTPVEAQLREPETDRRFWVAWPALTESVERAAPRASRTNLTAEPRTVGPQNARFDAPLVVGWDGHGNPLRPEDPVAACRQLDTRLRSRGTGHRGRLLAQSFLGLGPARPAAAKASA
jgi:hypothetical protein